MVAPLKDIEPLPTTAVIVPPPQLPDRPFGVETTRPAGRLSVKPIPVSVVAELLFLMVKVREDELPVDIPARPNDLLIVGGATTVIIVEACAVSTVAMAKRAPIDVALNVAPAVPVALIAWSAPVILPPSALKLTGNPINAVRLETLIGLFPVSVRKLAVKAVDPPAGMEAEAGVTVSVKAGSVVRVPAPGPISFSFGPPILAHQLSVKSAVPPVTFTVFPLAGVAVVLLTKRLKLK